MNILKLVDNTFTSQDWAHYYDTFKSRQASFTTLQMYVAQRAVSCKAPIYVQQKWASINHMFRRLMYISPCRDINITNATFDNSKAKISWTYTDFDQERKKDVQKQDPDVAELQRLFDHLDCNTNIDINDIILVRDFKDPQIDDR